MKDVMIGTWAWGPGNNGSKMVFGQSYDENSLRETFDEAVRLGLIKWDTAAVYGMGSCEKLLGKFINGREDIFLSTKYFPNKKFRTGDLEKSFEEIFDSIGRINDSYRRMIFVRSKDIDALISLLEKLTDKKYIAGYENVNIECVLT